MQATKGGEHLSAWPEPQVKGIAQNDLRTHLAQISGHHAFDRAVGAHGHEDRGLHDAVVQVQHAAACMLVLGCQFKAQHGGRPQCVEWLWWGMGSKMAELAVLVKWGIFQGAWSRRN